MPRRMLFPIVMAVLLLGIVIYGVFDPAESGFFPRCPFYLLTGLKCPGCGSQRAVHQLLTFHPLEALRYNALVVASIPLLAFFLLAELMQKKWPKLYSFSHNTVLAWVILAIIGLWWLLRNIFGF